MDGIRNLFRLLFLSNVFLTGTRTLVFCDFKSYYQKQENLQPCDNQLLKFSYMKLA